MIEYDKLVRDKIPDIIEAEGKMCNVEILSEDEYICYLNKKLLEEAGEYLDNLEVEELADLEEVLRAILDARGVSYKEFETIVAESRETRSL